MATFNLEKWMDDQGMSLKGVDGQGRPLVEDSEGRVGPLNIDRVLKDFNLSRKDVQLKINTPDSALDDSPISITDRAKLAVGNTRGQVNYLKAKFDDAAYTPDKGLVVKDKGIWKKVDKSSMDPYELTADIVEGAVNLAPSLIGSTAGAVAGTAAAGPVGGITGAGAGAGVAQKIRGTLGRALGTYDATPEEELKDIGWEVLLNAGGQGLALGAKPLMNKIIGAAKNISKSAPEATKGVLIEAIGRTTGAGPEATSVLFEAPEQVGKQISRAIAKYGNEQAAMDGLKQQNLRAVGRLIDEAPEALTRQFGTLADDLAKSAPKNFEVNVGSLIKEAQDELVAKGMGQVEEDGLFRILTNKEGLNKILAGEQGNLLDDSTREAVNKMVSVLNQLGKGGSAQGETAVKALMEIKKNINAVTRSIADGNQSPTLKKFVGDIRDSVLSKIGDKFASAGLGEKYLATSSLYEKFAGAVNTARKLQRQTNGDELLLNRLLSGVGRNQTYKDLAQDMATLVGPKGDALLQGIRLRDAAGKFTGTLPKVTLNSVSVGGVAAALTAGGVISPTKALLGATQASPRLVAKEVEMAAKILPYAKKMSDFVRDLTPKMRLDWLKNPTLVDSTVRATIDSIANEEASTKRLLGDQ